MIKELVKLAKQHRSLLPEDSNYSASYKNGYDIGYNLGYAHALEFVVSKLSKDKPGEKP